MTTIISPTQGGFHKPTVVAGNKTDASTDGEDIVLTPVVARHFRQLYNKLRGRDSMLSRADLAAFLEGVQGETVKPLEKERYRFEEFLEVWWHEYGWRALKPLTDAPDLSKPISNYFISSSHNTYLDGDQYFSNSSAAMYRKVGIALMIP